MENKINDVFGFIFLRLPYTFYRSLQCRWARCFQTMDGVTVSFWAAERWSRDLWLCVCPGFRLSCGEIFQCVDAPGPLGGSAACCSPRQTVVILTEPGPAWTDPDWPGPTQADLDRPGLTWTVPASRREAPQDLLHTDLMLLHVFIQRFFLNLLFLGTFLEEIVSKEKSCFIF